MTTLCRSVSLTFMIALVAGWAIPDAGVWGDDGSWRKSVRKCQSNNFGGPKPYS